MIYQEWNSVGTSYYECIRYTDFFWTPHLHKHPELLSVREGEVICESGGRRERIRAGEYALILSHVPHSFYTPGHSLVDVCIFSFDHAPLFEREVAGMQADRVRFLIPEPSRSFVDTQLLCGENSVSLPARDAADTEKLPLSHRQEPPLYLRKAAIYTLAQYYVQQVPLTPKETKDEELLRRIFQYIEEHFTEPLSLKEMAAELGYDSHYLSRYFHQYVPIHFSRFINSYRVQKASYLLTNTELPISQIIQQCGFQSQRSFNRAFSETLKHSPSMERKKK